MKFGLDTLTAGQTNKLNIEISSVKLTVQLHRVQEERAATQARSPHNKNSIVGHHQSQEKKKPDTEKEIPSSHGNFDRIVEPFDLDSAPIQVAKWKSRETGLSVVWADVEGPLVNGYLNVATEIFNESGVIHWNT
ncbi:hypothetical protein Pst134EA_007850 [Puccinia striiformis f. sp. tritici]|uniref:hypothetical protein n=1 Tax=Puccinia striiformis f. sp. tritici TaxID=168172 RepID=UPI00200883A4|nr:hypothetical protein Pst134EA_007850 [Puccinia striiformis f. sp. tritici]KAH9470603.1 hypothetical protein Pst134EA_007850 [Puccinia striiformis f. sp. tritici]